MLKKSRPRAYTTYIYLEKVPRAYS